MARFIAESQGSVIDNLEAAYEKLLEPGASLHQPSEFQREGFLDIAVSFAGTWMHSGYSSHIGACFVIDCETGTAIDFVVMCNHCSACIIQEKKSGEDYARWKDRHSTFACQKNFDGKAGTMEAEGTVRLFQCSTGYGLCNMTFVEDIDSSAFNAVRSLCDRQG